MLEAKRAFDPGITVSDESTGQGRGFAFLGDMLAGVNHFFRRKK
jgi:hypothetical protein